MGIFGLIMPGVDNQAHLGGFIGGYLGGLLLDPLKPERIDHVAAAVACLAVTLAAIVWSVVSALPFLMRMTDVRILESPAPKNPKGFGSNPVTAVAPHEIRRFAGASSAVSGRLESGRIAPETQPHLSRPRGVRTAIGSFVPSARRPVAGSGTDARRAAKSGIALAGDPP